MEKINEHIKTIKDNLFTNDMQWRERGNQNNILAHKIREIIAMDKELDKTVKGRMFIVETLEFLDNHNL